MGILKRFNDIMASNINALLDKAEDPEKMVDQTLRNLNEELGQVKAETAGVMADEKAAKRELDEKIAEINKYQAYAEKAVNAGNDDDARVFLQKKAEAENAKTDLENAYNTAHANSEKMKQMYAKLTKDVDTLEEKRNTIKAKIRTAKAQERLNKVTSKHAGASASLSEFDRLDKKADQMLDKANAERELDEGDQTAEDLMAKYDNPSQNSSVDDELAALKAKLGK